jgi:hypothetical protein
MFMKILKVMTEDSTPAIVERLAFVRPHGVSASANCAGATRLIRIE